jgi:hypothetical protein
LRFILFVEGDTEANSLGAFFQRWLNPRLSKRVGIGVVNLKGNRFARDLPNKVRYYVGRDRGNDVIALFGLLDLYKGAPYPADVCGADERYDWGVRHYEELVANNSFRMFFAVHEIEAWLLSQTDLFPRRVRGTIPDNWTQRPEHVNFDNAPAKRLNDAYLAQLNRSYRKITDGANLFRRLDVEVAYARCPHLKRMLDTMLDLAKNALKEN